MAAPLPLAFVGWNNETFSVTQPFPWDVTQWPLPAGSYFLSEARASAGATPIALRFDSRDGSMIVAWDSANTQVDLTFLQEPRRGRAAFRRLRVRRDLRAPARGFAAARGRDRRRDHHHQPGRDAMTTENLSGPLTGAPPVINPMGIPGPLPFVPPALWEDWVSGQLYQAGPPASGCIGPDGNGYVRTVTGGETVWTPANWMLFSLAGEQGMSASIVAAAQAYATQAAGSASGAAGQLALATAAAATATAAASTLEFFTLAAVSRCGGDPLDGAICPCLGRQRHALYARPICLRHVGPHL